MIRIVNYYMILVLFSIANLCLGKNVKVYPDVKPNLKQLRQQRQQMAKRRRRIIFNNDGGDAYKYPKNRPRTPAGLIAIRTPTKSSQVDTISYCTISSSFGMFTHHTKVGECITQDYPGGTTINLARLFDPLQVMVNWAKQNGKEIFWSMRMNDVHDSQHTPKKPYFRWSKLKQTHPEYLMAVSKKRLPHGRWSAVDYTHPEIRDLAYRYIEEVCHNYDIDGIELDFFRHLYLFKSVVYGGQANTAELKMMTDLMRRIRAMTEREGLKRGRPILVSIRVPDSVEYCRGVGIDLERWLALGLVDMVIGSGYFQLNPWKYMVELCHRYNIQFYAGLSEPRVYGQGKLKRRWRDDYRARAMAAWQAGVDGIYIFNEYRASKSYLNEIGDPARLTHLNKHYFATYLKSSVNHYLKGGEKFLNLPQITPKHPALIMLGGTVKIPLWIGDDINLAINTGYSPKVICKVWLSNFKDKYNLQIKFNQHLIKNYSYSNNYLSFKITARYLLRGKNYISFKLIHSNRKQNSRSKTWLAERIFDSDKILKWPAEAPFWKWPSPSHNKTVTVENRFLHVIDQGVKNNEMMMILHPWGIFLDHKEKDVKVIIESMIKVKQSSKPLAVALRIADGRSVEYLTISPNKIGLYFAKLSYSMNTTSKFHLYRVEIIKNNLSVYVDGKLCLDGKGRFITSVTNKQAQIAIKLPYYLKTINKSGIGIGSFSASGKSSAFYQFIRYDTEMVRINDIMLQIRYK